LGTFEEAQEEIAASQTEIAKLDEAFKETVSKGFDAIQKNTASEFDEFFVFLNLLIARRLGKLRSGASLDTDTVKSLSEIAPALSNAGVAVSNAPAGAGRENLEARLATAFEFLQAAAIRLADSGEVADDELSKVIKTVVGFTAETKRLETFVSEVAEARIAEAFGAKETAEAIKNKTKRQREYRQELQTSGNQVTAVIAELVALQKFEEARENELRRRASSIAQFGILQQQGGAQQSRAGNIQSTRAQIGSLEFQRKNILDDLKNLSGGDLIAANLAIAELDANLSNLNLTLNELEGGLPGFQDSLFNFIDNLPTRAEIAFEAVSGFAERTSQFLSETIANGVKILVQDGFGSFKDAVDDLDKTLGQFFGNLLIDLGAAIIKAVLLRTIMSAIGGPLGGLFGFNTGGPVPRMGFNDGGNVGGPPGVNRDVVPAMLTPGEFVIRKQAAQTLGTNFLMGLNTLGGPSSRFAKASSGPRIGGVRGFNMGGQVAAMAGGGGGPQPSYLLSNETNAQSFLQGGENAFLSFLRENRNKF